MNKYLNKVATRLGLIPPTQDKPEYKASLIRTSTLPPLETKAKITNNLSTTNRQIDSQ